MRQAVVIFAKEAIPGKVKTRLGVEVGDELAAQYYRAFARDVFEMVEGYARDEGGCRPYLAWTGSKEGSLMEDALGLGFTIIDQGSGGLGERMESVVGEMRKREFDQVLIIGTDSPTLMPDHLASGFASLKQHDLVYGPSFDGGYYLVGINLRSAFQNEIEATVFRNISWSTSEVLGESLRAADRAGLLCDLLGFWYDIDTFEDLKMMWPHLRFLRQKGLEVGQHSLRFLPGA